MTSNVGTRVVSDFGTGVGFQTSSKEGVKTDEVSGILEKELKKKFAPEFLNRIDEIIYFKDLNKEDISKIVTIELNKSLNRLKEIGYDSEIKQELVDKLVEVGYDPKFGARPLKRAIQKWIDDSITEFIIEESPTVDSKLILDYNKEEDKTQITVDKPKKKKKKAE